MNESEKIKLEVSLTEYRDLLYALQFAKIYAFSNKLDYLYDEYCSVESSILSLRNSM